MEIDKTGGHNGVGGVHNLVREVVRDIRFDSGDFAIAECNVLALVDTLRRINDGPAFDNQFVFRHISTPRVVVNCGVWEEL
jgi:hypothetical protein